MRRCRSGCAIAARPSGVARPPQHHAPRHVGRLEDHAARHLRLADAPFDEDDRDLADRAAAAVRLVEHLDEERVAVRDDPLERHLGQRFAAPAAEAAGAVGDRHPGHAADVAVGEGAQDQPVQRPVDDADALQVARADDQVMAAAQRHLHHLGQVLGIVREVRVHLADEVLGAGARQRQRLDVGAAEPLLAGAVQHLDAVGELAGQRVGDLAGAVGRLVVDHHHAEAGMRDDVAHQPGQVLPLVVGRNQDERRRDGGGGRRDGGAGRWRDRVHSRDRLHEASPLRQRRFATRRARPRR